MESHAQSTDSLYQGSAREQSNVTFADVPWESSVQPPLTSTTGIDKSNLLRMHRTANKPINYFNLKKSTPGRPFSGLYDDSLVSSNAMMMRGDSFGSDQSDCLPSTSSPSRFALNNANLRLRDGRRFRLYKSLSSSEDEVRSTPEFSTEDDYEMESESISLSEKGDFFRSRKQPTLYNKQPDEIMDAKMKNFLVVSLFGSLLELSMSICFPTSTRSRGNFRLTTPT